MLKESGIKERMAKHISHLFIRLDHLMWLINKSSLKLISIYRDTVSLFSEKVNQDDEKDTDHFENIQSTNWQTMRFKPPPPNSSIGWRVEFRPCELQFTEFENAAVVCFLVLLTRAILSFNFNLLIPISKVDENMKRSQKRDAIINEKFFFRTNITTTCDDHKPPIIEELTIDQIINGEPKFDFPGLMPLVSVIEILLKSLRVFD